MTVVKIYLTKSIGENRSFPNDQGGHHPAASTAAIQSSYMASKRPKRCIDLWWSARARSLTVTVGERPWESDAVPSVLRPVWSLPKRGTEPKLFPRHSTMHSSAQGLAWSNLSSTFIGPDQKKKKTPKGKFTHKLPFINRLLHSSSALFLPSFTLRKSLSLPIINHSTLNDWSRPQTVPYLWNFLVSWSSR